ncbi:MAG: cupin domain-containing protein [Actinomycetota bacterium]|nr:cupin domain-containing protein [Actinomycetota bacterium]
MPPTDGMAVGEVFFQPCARTNWHSHPGGQLLLITAGDGFVGDENETIAVRAGDAVWTPPNERHWHGASADRFMLHTAVTLGVTAWEDPVTDAEYDAAGRSTES